MTFEFTNDASLGHDFVIEDSEGSEVARTEVITGSSTAADADLEAGEYTFYCSVGAHREAGDGGPADDRVGLATRLIAGDGIYLDAGIAELLGGDQVGVNLEFGGLLPGNSGGYYQVLPGRSRDDTVGLNS